MMLGEYLNWFYENKPDATIVIRNGLNNERGNTIYKGKLKDLKTTQLKNGKLGSTLLVRTVENTKHLIRYSYTEISEFVIILERI